MIYTLEDRTQAATGELVFDFTEGRLGVIGDEAGRGSFELHGGGPAPAVVAADRCCSVDFAITKGWTTRELVAWASPMVEPEPEPTCAWFALCSRPATTTRFHPLGEVPICAECDAKVARLGGSVAR